MKRYYFIGFFSIVFSLFFYLNKPQEDESDHTSISSPKQEKFAKEKLSSANSEKKNGDNDCDSTPLYSAEKVAKGIEANRSKVDYISNAYVDIRTKVQNLEHDSAANMSIFTLISLCQGNGQQACGGINASAFYKDDPIELLEKASELGSNDAKLMYALNAPLAALQIRKRDHIKGEIRAAEIMSKAEKFGIEAAQSGQPDAFRYMSQSYQNGRFGQKDNGQALAFILPLSHNGSQEDKERIQELSKTLSPERISKAQHLAFGCIGTSDARIFSNPFG
jgi:hypothetical protein